MIDNIAVSRIKVEPGLPQEDKIPGEGTITYDIHFNAALPAKVKGEHLIINIEPQGRDGSVLLPRSVLYCARMLSEQMGHIHKEHYEELQKVYSIWIILNSSQKNANTIVFYGLRETNRIGNYRGADMPELMNIVIVRLPRDGEREKAKNQETALTGMLSTLLASDIQADAKMKILREEYGIETSIEMKEDVENMATFAEGYLEVMAQEARKKARREVRKEARQETKNEIVMNMIKSGKLTDQDIASYADVSLSQVQKIREKMDLKN